MHIRPQVVDAHSDFLCDVMLRRRQGEKQVLERRYLPQYRACGLKVVVAAIYLEGLFVPHLALETALEMISCLQQELEESPGLFALCRTAGELDEALSRRRIAILLSLEGAEPIGTNLNLLRIFFDLGVRLMGLTWARRNAAADGAMMAAGAARSKAGLTAFGRALVEQAAKLGMAIDVSHLNDAGLEELLQIGGVPVFASHSNARTLYDKERNIHDDAIRTIAARGGVVGVNAINTLLAADDADATPARIAEHIRHIAGVAGLGGVGLGLDFCDDLPDFSPPPPPKAGERRVKDVLAGYTELDRLLDQLEKAGFSPEEIRGIAGENFLRFYRAVLPR